MTNQDSNIGRAEHLTHLKSLSREVSAVMLAEFSIDYAGEKLAGLEMAAENLVLQETNERLNDRILELEKQIRDYWHCQHFPHIMERDAAERFIDHAKLLRKKFPLQRKTAKPSKPIGKR